MRWPEKTTQTGGEANSGGQRRPAQHAARGSWPAARARNGEAVETMLDPRGGICCAAGRGDRVVRWWAGDGWACPLRWKVRELTAAGRR